MPSKRIAGRAGANGNATLLGADIPALPEIERRFVASPERLEEIARRILVVDRLTEGAVLGMIDRAFVRHAMGLERGANVIEPAARYDEPVPEPVRTAVLIGG